MHEPAGPPPSLWMEEVDDAAGAAVARRGRGRRRDHRRRASRGSRRRSRSARAGASVVVLERRDRGFGASGRNAGHLTPTIGKDLPTLAALLRRERAPRPGRARRSARSATSRRRSRSTASTARYEPVGNVHGGGAPEAAPRARPGGRGRRDARARRRAARAGDAMRARGAARARSRAGSSCGAAASCIPGATCAGSGASRSRPARVLYEQTPRRCTSRTATRCVADDARRPRSARARSCSRPTPTRRTLGWLRSRVLRLYVYLFATAPLDGPPSATTLGWARPRGHLHRARDARELSPDATTSASSAARSSCATATAAAPLSDDPATFVVDRGRRSARASPRWATSAITHRWGGPIALRARLPARRRRAGRHATSTTASATRGTASRWRATPARCSPT